MPFPISIVGVVVTGAAVAIVGAVAHENHSNHRNYSDAAERKKEEELKARRERAAKELESANARKDEAVHTAIAQVQKEFQEANIPFPQKVCDLLKCRPGDTNGSGPVFFAWMNVNASSCARGRDFLAGKDATSAAGRELGKEEQEVINIVQERVEQYFNAEISEKNKEISDINALLQRIVTLQLTGDKHERN